MSHFTHQERFLAGVSSSVQVNLLHFTDLPMAGDQLVDWAAGLTYT